MSNDQEPSEGGLFRNPHSGIPLYRLEPIRLHGSCLIQVSLIPE
jgi:hypothetical protein